MIAAALSRPTPPCPRPTPFPPIVDGAVVPASRWRAHRFVELEIIYGPFVHLPIYRGTGVGFRTEAGFIAGLSLAVAESLRRGAVGDDVGLAGGIRGLRAIE